MSEEASKLAGMIDGVTISEEDAKALWKEFSEHMDANRGDMGGFAKKKGWFSIAPEYRGGKAVLIVRTTANAKGPPAVAAPQRPKFKARQGAKPKAQQGAKGKPQQSAKATPRAGQKGPQKPNQPSKPKPPGGGGQAPPKKRPG
jgi:hypothetical protein